MLNDLLNMYCGDEITKGPYIILKVPGGWLYTFMEPTESSIATTTFVPEPEEKVIVEQVMKDTYVPPNIKFCKHKWADADNEHVKNAKVCLNCHTVRPKDPPSTKEVS